MAENINLLDIENDPHILDFETYDGVPIWMMARYYLLYKVAGGKVYGYKSSDRDRKINIRMASNIIRTVFYNLKNKKQWREKSILLYSTNRKTIMDGKYFNRYVDCLYDCFPNDSLIIEQPLMDWEWPFPRHSENVYFDTLSKICGEIKSKISYKKDIQKTKELIDFFSVKLENSTGYALSDSEKDSCVVSISKLITTMRYQAKWIEKHVTEKTKIAIIIGAGFPYYYFMNERLRKKNIISVELQHGFITRTNIMYNYSSNLAEDYRVKKGMPEYVLTYGDWWNGQMNVPTNEYSIGNPYRDYAIRRLRGEKKNKSIVVIGTSEKTEEYIKLTKCIAERLCDYSVVYRPHPGEGSLAKVIAKKYGVLLDDNSEIYDTLKETEIIISEVTTVLFEAIGIVKRILVWDTEFTRAYLPNHPFEIFKTVDDLIIMIKNESAKQLSDEMFWEKNWERRYRDFIESLNIL